MLLPSYSSLDNIYPINKSLLNVLYKFKNNSDGVTVLGVPHGSDMFIQRELSAIVDKTELGLQELRHLAWYHREDSMQCALLLLRYCAVPRFSHVLRALPVKHKDTAHAVFSRGARVRDLRIQLPQSALRLLLSRSRLTLTIRVLS